MAKPGPEKLTPYQRLARRVDHDPKCREPETPAELIKTILWAASKGALHVRDVRFKGVPSATAIYFLEMAHRESREFSQVVKQALLMMPKIPAIPPDEPEKTEKAAEEPRDVDAELMAASRGAREPDENDDSDA